MSIARKCDRCEKLFEPKLIYDGHMDCYYSIRVNMENDRLLLDKVYNSDLCPECYEELRAWIEMEGEE